MGDRLDLKQAKVDSELLAHNTDGGRFGEQNVTVMSQTLTRVRTIKLLARLGMRVF